MNELAYAKHIGECLAHSWSSVTVDCRRHIYTAVSHNTRDPQYEGTSEESDYISCIPTFQTATTQL